MNTVWLVECEAKLGGKSGRKWVPLYALYADETDAREALREYADDPQKRYRKGQAHLMAINQKMRRAA